MLGRGRAVGAVLAVCVVLLVQVSQAKTVAPRLRGARVASGELTEQGANFLAGESGVVLNIEHGSQLAVAPGTRFRFGRPLKLPLGVGANSMVPARVVIISEGRVDAQVPETNPLSFAVLFMSAHELRSINKGGRTAVSVTEDRVALASFEGVQLYTVGKGWKRLREGFTRTFQEAFPQGRKREQVGYTKAPELSKRLLLAGQKKALTRPVASWEPVDDAFSYEVVLWDQAGQRVSSWESKQTTHAVHINEPGNYALRVRARDSNGFEGLWSEPTSVNVIGLDIPQTAMATDDGKIRLQPGQRVGLIGSEGLEIGYVGFESFLPAPNTLGLVGRRPISAILRHPKTKEIVPLDLIPMEVKAQIELGRHPKRWPAGGLPIEITLMDTQGHPIPEDFELNIRVGVNVQPVSVDWERSGNRLLAVIPKPGGAGPWVVRVEVRDVTGVLLGRDFTEVAYEAPKHDTTTKSHSRSVVVLPPGRSPNPR